MKRASKTAAAALLALVMAVFALTGCTKTDPGIITLHDSETLKIEREGAETRVYDLAGNAEYTFTAHRVKKSTGAAAQISEARTTTDTETITLQTVYDLIIITDKATGATYYVRGATL